MNVISDTSNKTYLNTSHWIHDTMSFDNLDGMKSYVDTTLKLMQDDLNNAPRSESVTRKILFHCESADKTFLITGLNILKETENNNIGITIEYRVYHCDYSYILDYEIHGLRDAEDVVHAIFHCVLDMHLCKECFTLTSSEHQLCNTCIPNRIREEYSRVHRGNTNIDVCTICMETVYTSRIRCGHSFHRTCLIGLCKNRWFDENTKPIKCPLCRAEITSEDKYDYFMYSSCS